MKPAPIASKGSAGLESRSADALSELFVRGALGFALVTLDALGRVLHWNEAAKRVFGYSQEEIVGRPFDRFFRLEDRASGKPALELKMARIEGAVVEDSWLVRKDGSLFWASCACTPIRDDRGDVAGFAKLVRDASESRRLREALSQSEERERESVDRAVVSSIERLQLLSETAEKLLVGDDPLPELDVVFEDLQRAFQVDCYFHFRRVPDDPQLQLRASRGVDPAVIRRLTDKTEPSVCSLVAAELRPKVIEDLQGTSGEAGGVLREIGLSAYACFPLMAKEGLLGTLSFGSKRTPSFSFESINLFRVIADLFASAIARRETEYNLRRKERKLQLLNRIGEATREERDPRQIMRVTTRELGEELKVSRCTYAVVAANEEDFVIAQDYTKEVESSVGHHQLSRFGATAAQAMRGASTLVVNDTAQELPESEQAGFRAIGVRAIICCPLVKDGRLKAMLAVHHVQPHVWGPEEIAMVKLVAERSWSTIERAKAEMELQQNEERLTLAIEAGQLGLWQIDLRANRVRIDDRVAELFGLAGSGDLDVGVVLDRVHPEDRPKVRDSLDRAWSGEAHFDVTFRTVAPDGREHWIAGKGILLRDAAQQRTHIVGVNYDLTTHMQAEEALRRAQRTLAQHAQDLQAAVSERTAELQDTVAELERFSYSLSHDLRAPLRAMQGFAGLLEDEYTHQLDEKGREYLRRISSAARRLDQLILDVLSYASVVRAEVALHPVELEPLLTQLIAESPDLQPDRANVHLHSPLAAVMAHEGYLTQCVSNILSNAAKFVPAGRKPEITIWTERSGDTVRVCVQDNGLGIKKEWRGRIFEMFQRLHSAAAYEGTGIGLSIVQKAVERMGGEVGVESESGVGSTFWLRLKAAP